eukprot:CAMPEP_0185589632 /NCGR_PEP_ID=MMETSP0434-20130131/57771_1 /TAXON_ID=626734 ORGANISM="Favella taraikaensis, Strain Fe Narragansett Bay" /NCGR_SAMPLE_ID=MMETSP0434 /ASSEMBLY_ACC=CAM_ASM_000379 /LENGTH=170 /DNA_ID=CAMNT_0028213185 /DNA_START=408 /DNA_END=920 /DNA_ORIENTATION=+
MALSFPFRVVNSYLDLQDELFNFDYWTQTLDKNAFMVEMGGFRGFSKNQPDVLVSLDFERDLNLKYITRDRYTLLDWISDIGGIQGMLVSAFAFFVGYWNYKSVENFMVAKLYKTWNPLEAKTDDDEDKKPPTYRSELIEETTSLNLCVALEDTLPSWLSYCCCSTKSRQ